MLTQPLLHLWSLGVEEQFYLFWPLVLTFGLQKFSTRTFILFILVLTIASFVLGEALLGSKAMFSYYMLPTRAGELFVGAICFFSLRNPRLSNLSPGVYELVSWIGLGSILLSLAWLSEDRVFPGLNAVPVTLGTALLIFSGSMARTRLSRVFSLRPLVAIGLISYSMYLWHWPLLAFVKYVFTDPTILQKTLSFIAIVVLSVLSYQFVEKPFKADSRNFSTVAIRQLIIPSSAIIFICSLIIGSAGYGLYYFNDSYKGDLKVLNDSARPAYQFPYVCQDYLLTTNMLSNRDCIIGGVGEPKVLLWGDSNAAYYVGVLGELAKQYGFSFRNAIHSSCPPLLHDPQRFVSSRLKQGCELSNREIVKIIGQYETVILAGSWNVHLKENGSLFTEEMQKSISELVQNGKRVILLGRVPGLKSFDRKCGLKSLKFKDMNCSDRAIVPRGRVQKVNAKIESIATSSGALYFDINDILCKDDSCSGFLDGQLIYFDPGHLNMSGSILIGTHLRADENAYRIFSVLENQTHDSIIHDLPWEKNTGSWLDNLDENQKNLVVGTKELLNPDRWAGASPKRLLESDLLLFEDKDKESYQTSVFNLGKYVDVVRNRAKRSEYLLFEMKIQRNQLNFPLIRFRVNQEKKVDYDFIVDGSRIKLYQRGAKNGVYSDIKDLDNLVELSIAIPLRLFRGDPKLFISPAASNRNLKYSKEYTGQIVVERFEIFLVDRA